MIVMDEATPALDDQGQASLLRLLREEFSEATVICVFFDRKLLLERRPTGSRVVNQTLRQSLWRRLKQMSAALLGSAGDRGVQSSLRTLT
jgi:ABC-type Mn2+/Zn2+ transport system ATPase subunit